MPSAFFKVEGLLGGLLEAAPVPVLGHSCFPWGSDYKEMEGLAKKARHGVSGSSSSQGNF